MKHFIKLAFIGILAVAITGCEDSQVTPNDAKQDVAGAVIYSITNVDGVFEADPIDLNKAKNSVPSKQVKPRNPNSSATGIYNFPPFGEDFLTFNFTAMENPGGVHGSTHIVGSEGAGLLDVWVDSDCILVDGNQAFFGGVITDWTVTEELQDFFDNVLGGPYTGFGVGHQIYWSVQDNGEGANADPDGGGDAYIIVPEGVDAVENGFESWCEFTERDYDGEFHPPFTHGYLEGGVPSNVQVQ